MPQELTDPATATPAPAPETPGIVIGNHTHKYSAKNPVIRWLTLRWVVNLERVMDRIASESQGRQLQALEVGCGEGVISGKLHQRWPSSVGLDLPDAGLRADWRAYQGPRFLHADAHRLPFRENQFDVIVSVEVLEHLTDPELGLAEITRVGREHIVLSVPREPIFRGSNFIAGRYVADFGNTPGHLNHWSTRSFVKFVSRVADIRDVSKPFPWTTVWATLR